MRGAIVGKTGKTAVLHGFCKIEWGVGRDSHAVVVLACLLVCAVPVVPQDQN